MQQWRKWWREIWHLKQQRKYIGQEDNDFEDFQNHNYDSDKYKDRNSVNDTNFFDNLVCENTADDLVIPDILDHYCGPHGLKEDFQKIFQTVLECIMITSAISMEYFRQVNAH